MLLRPYTYIHKWKWKFLPNNFLHWHLTHVAINCPVWQHLIQLCHRAPPSPSWLANTLPPATVWPVWLTSASSTPTWWTLRPHLGWIPWDGRTRRRRTWSHSGMPFWYFSFAVSYTIKLTGSIKCKTFNQSMSNSKIKCNSNLGLDLG